MRRPGLLGCVVQSAFSLVIAAALRYGNCFAERSHLKCRPEPRRMRSVKFERLFIGPEPAGFDLDSSRSLTHTGNHPVALRVGCCSLRRTGLGVDHRDGRARDNRPGRIDDYAAHLARPQTRQIQIG